MTAAIAAALAHVSAAERETWVRMGMAVKAELGDAGFVLWDAWSRTADNYNAAAAKSVWKSIRGAGVTIASLYREAKANGWSGTPEPVDPALQEARHREATLRAAADARKVEARHRRVADEAVAIITRCRPELHRYLAAKGFTEQTGLVWERGRDDHVLVVPMRVGSRIFNLQLIAADGTKRFLPGGRASAAEHVFDLHGPFEVLCEGYATGLSVRAALLALRVRCRVHVTFSAGNMLKIARGLRPGLVIADRDASGTGERAARAIGWPYWMSPVLGEDANDAHRRMGLFQLSQSIGAVLHAATPAGNSTTTRESA